MAAKKLPKRKCKGEKPNAVHDVVIQGTATKPTPGSARRYIPKSARKSLPRKSIEGVRVAGRNPNFTLAGSATNYRNTPGTKYISVVT